MTDLSRAVLTEHLRQRATRRDLPLEQVRAALAAPDVVREVRPGRVVAQRASRELGIAVLVRVVVDVDRDPPEAVTAYRTSKIRKYGSSP